MDIRTRKAIGCAGLLAYLAVYAVLAATLGAYLLPILPFWAELIFYAAAGIVWIFPLKPLFAWINRT
ncbi:MAG TPA: DUF2842 domain-containing protein [Vitreimonas sp.]|uniref:DUF2842 domain-containing protein n=1 Tax=Vitreimonas sp. TaxID=3069702 RepID=UPI002D5D659E|nr:DUF2842 domain-containing protein [Vitreimonas sp.]HYD85918.1 DUF2842 domain-containing protein [Vitreimonas sp.]